jgi:HEAT repeat protein
MAKRSFEDQLAKLEALSREDPEQAVAPLRMALRHANNFLVAKAAEMTRRFNLKELTPDLVAAYERFFEDAEKCDPQCWAKNALSRTLADFEYEDSGVFLRGLRHVQMEPVWGGRSDTAATLRATCAQALVSCRDLRETELLALLIELFRDKDKTVRVEAARAMVQVGSDAAALLLRLRVTLGNDEPEVLAACFSGVLELEGTAAIAWVEEFLAAADDTAAEAGLALGQTRTLEAFTALKKAISGQKDSWFCGVLLTAIAMTRREEAFHFLLELVREESRLATDAITAVLHAAPPAEVTERLEAVVRSTENARLLQAFEAARRA